MKGVMNIFLRDFATYLDDKGVGGIGGINTEVWNINTNNFPFKESTKLNRELDIHKLNKQNNEKNFKIIPKGSQHPPKV